MRFVILFTFGYLLPCVYGQNQQIDFESDLVSWPRLKRSAGYRTEGGTYRGGLYRNARDEEHEYYQCLQNNTDHCLTWRTSERSSGEVEQGTCYCRDGDTPYCAQWSCSQIEIGLRGCDDDGCSVHAEETDCFCDQTDSNGRYCSEWSCTEIGSGGAVEHETYICLEEDVSEEFCHRWKGDSSSSYEIESSVCECVTSGVGYCEYWECKERGLIRCAAHYGGWCDLNIAIGVGGGAGVVFIFLGLLYIMIDWVDDDFCWKFFGLMACFVIGCLPWTVGVVIWGGVRGMPWVAGMWGIALIVGVCIILMTTPKHTKGHQDQ